MKKKRGRAFEEEGLMRVWREEKAGRNIDDINFKLQQQLPTSVLKNSLLYSPMKYL